MEILLGIIVICILIIAVLLLYIRSYKHQLRVFSKHIRNTAVSTENQDISPVNSPVTVETFNSDIVDLANALNQYTEDMRGEYIRLNNEREHLRNVIAGISHDFRTPLTSALGYMQLLDKSTVLGEDERKYLEIACEKTMYMKNLSDDFFELSAISAKKEELPLEQVNITRILSEQLLAQYDWISERGITLKTKVDETRLLVKSNEHILERMLDNIFSNARKYAVSELIVALEEDADGVRIVVENDIDKDMRIDADRVFAPFYRNAQGTGSIVSDGITGNSAVEGPIMSDGITGNSAVEGPIMSDGIIEKSAGEELITSGGISENGIWNSTDNRGYGGSGLGLYIVKQLAECIGADVKAKVYEERFIIQVLFIK